MGNLGPGELIVIGLIALLLFGAGRIADIGKGLGQGIRQFKQGLKDDDGSKTAGAADVPATDARVAAGPATPPAGGGTVADTTRKAETSPHEPSDGTQDKSG